MNKPKVGQIIYSLNVGNDVRGCEQVLTPMIVSKVGRKYFTCDPEGCNWGTQFYLDDWREKSEYTSNHCLYENKQEVKKWEDEKIKDELIRIIKVQFNYYNKYGIDLDKVKKIVEIIKS